jgi:hypothetical protein
MQLAGIQMLFGQGCSACSTANTFGTSSVELCVTLEDCSTSLALDN